MGIKINGNKNKWGQVLFFASQLLTYSNKTRKEGIERKLVELAKKYYDKKQKTRPDPLECQKISSISAAML